MPMSAACSHGWRDGRSFSCPRDRVSSHLSDFSGNETRQQVIRKGKPFDLKCQKGKRVKYVEVKGTKTEGKSTLLTRNEVDFANKNKGKMVLYIQYSVDVRGAKKPSVSGGKHQILDPWRISNRNLEATKFVYTLNR